MMYQYFYAPVFVGDTGTPEKPRVQYDPGYIDDGGELVSAVPLLPPRTQCPVCDKGHDPMRFVMRMPLNWEAPDDWLPTTLAEVAEAYPGQV